MLYHLPSARPSPGRPTAAAACPWLAIGLLILAACGGGDGNSAAPQGTLVLGPQETCARDLAETPADVTVYGASAGDYLADRFSLATGDFNDDGFADALVGAPLADGPGDARENAGEAYIIFGSSQPATTVDLAEGAPVTIFGENPGDNLGFTVASGDVNGDGRADAIVGARFASTAEAPGAGKAYVILGRADLPGAVDTARGDQDATITGLAGTYLTIALAAGDVDGDGTDDLIMGAAGMAGPEGDRPTAGGVMVVRGTADLGATDLARAEPFMRIYGATAGDNVPNHLAAGDLDGDGREDLIIGAPLVDGELREDAGAAYLVPVPEDGGDIDLSGSGGYQRITGGARKDMLGFQVAAGDVNGDGVADAIIGARDADGVGDLLNNAGEVHILFGGDSIPEGRDLMDGRSDVLLAGGEPNDSLGFSVAAGDVNGDGVTDVLAGAPVADSCGNSRPEGGDAYAVLGRKDWPGVVTLKGAGDVTFLGAEEGDGLGFSIAAGDFNGDGVSDVMTGALLADGPENTRPDGGELYIAFSVKQ